MSAVQQKDSTASRRWLIRGACAVVYVALLVLLFVNGKGHVILIDNKDAGDREALEYVLVGVDGAEGVEYYAGDRDKASVKGQKHRLTIELEDGTKVEKAIAVPLTEEMVLVSIPLLLADAEGSVVPFVPRDAVPPADTSGNVNEFTAPLGPDADAAPEAPPPAN